MKKGNSLNLILLFNYIILQFLDFFTTYYALGLGAIESNPLGFTLLTFSMKISSIICFILLIFISFKLKKDYFIYFTLLLLVFINTFYLLVVINNFSIILKLKY